MTLFCNISFLRKKAKEVLEADERALEKCQKGHEKCPCNCGAKKYKCDGPCSEEGWNPEDEAGTNSIRSV